MKKTFLSQIVSFNCKELSCAKKKYSYWFLHSSVKEELQFQHHGQWHWCRPLCALINWSHHRCWGKDVLTVRILVRVRSESRTPLLGVISGVKLVTQPAMRSYLSLKNSFIGWCLGTAYVQGFAWNTCSHTAALTVWLSQSDCWGDYVDETHGEKHTWHATLASLSVSLSTLMLMQEN